VRATRLAVKNGLAVAPKEDWDHLLWARFDGNIFDINDTIAYYDEDDDELVINRTHLAWTDMRAYIQDPRRKDHFSTRSPDHIIRHEIGHALHYRSLSAAERADIWYKDLLPEEKVFAAHVSDYSTEGRIEFVAETFAGHWAGRRFRPEVLALYEKLKGPSR
jgi:hypothetical protein